MAMSGAWTYDAIWWHLAPRRRDDRGPATRARCAGHGTRQSRPPALRGRRLARHLARSQYADLSEMREAGLAARARAPEFVSTGRLCPVV
eukprot:4959800-Prymnesium_polylepis.2